MTSTAETSSVTPANLATRLEYAIVALLAARAAAATICPSEAARRVAAETGTDWRPLMEHARQAAYRLVAAGRIEVTQRGKVVDPSGARGPIRLRLRAPRSDGR